MTIQRYGALYVAGFGSIACYGLTFAEALAAAVRQVRASS